MKKISEQQIQIIINQIAEAPAKYVFNAILTLQQLQICNEEKLLKELEELKINLKDKNFLEKELQELKEKGKDKNNSFYAEVDNGGLKPV